MKTPGRPTFALATSLGVWGLAFLLVVSNSVIEHDRNLGPVVVRFSVACIEGALLCLAADLAWSRRPAGPTRLDWIAASAFVIVGALQSAGILVAFILSGPSRGGPRPIASFLIADFGFFVWIYLAWAGLRLSMTLGRRLQEQEVRVARASAASLAAQNAMLRYQINPHFLFNTLNALSTLILDRRNDTAEQVVVAVGQFLRFSLEHGPQDRVTLEREIAAQELYLGIERVRFGERFVFSATLSEPLTGALVPSLILQPLVENAVKYAVAPTTALVRVAITAIEVDGRLQITVEDTGAGVPRKQSPGLGVGLGNVRARLAVLYGERGELICEQTLPQGYRARVLLPLEFA